MTPAEIDKVKKLIQQSNILSAMEKAEWNQLLADMTEKQVADLVAILTPRPRAVPPKVDIHQKEIGTSIPEHELEIPAHAGQPVIAPKVAAKPAAQAAPQKPFATPHLTLVSNDPSLAALHSEAAAREAEQRKIMAEQQAEAEAEEQAELAAKAAEPKPAAPKAIVPENLEIDLKQPADFANIAPENIHGHDPEGSYATILKSMNAAAKKSSIYDIIANFDKSPLYQAYLEMGFALLNDPNPDRDAAYKNALDQRKRSGQPWLTKEEFETFADLKKTIDQVF